MSTPISTIRNLGPAMEAAFARAGVPDAEALRAMGADAGYARSHGFCLRLLLRARMG